MELSTHHVMSIVRELSEIINQHVNLMDDQGYIIASTDLERIGQFHEGAATLLKNDLKELVIENDSQFLGSRKGINLPLLLNNRTAGVVGITGEYEEVQTYGQIIKKMTELMLTENYLNQQKKLDDRIRKRFFDEWILNAVPLTEDFIERGQRLGIDIKRPYRVLVIALANIDKHMDHPEAQMKIDDIGRAVKMAVLSVQGALFFKTINRMICLLPIHKNGDRSSDLILACQSIEKSFKVRLFIGLDGGGYTTHLRYTEASKACIACDKERPVRHFSDISLELFLDDVSTKSKQDFINRMFRSCTERELDMSILMLKAFFENNGSISKTAEELFIHKNTLQNRLNRLYEKTGHDPRNLADSALYYLALEFYKTLQDQPL